MTTTTDKLVGKFRAMADKLDGEIAAKYADRRCNTPKQSKEMASARIDGDHLSRVRTALRKLADAWESGSLPDRLSCITTKAALLTILATKIDTSGGYYSLRDTGEFRDQSATAVALREFLDAAKDWIDHLRDDTMAKARKIEELERQVKFSPIPGFFPTPFDVVTTMLVHLEPEAGLTALEPSAGKGDIAVRLRVCEMKVTTCEIDRTLIDILSEREFDVRAGDFFDDDLFTTGELFDRVCMNPPFENGADMVHVRRAYEMTKPGGILVSVMSGGPWFRSDRKSCEFRDWFGAVGGHVEDLLDDAFKGSFRSTGVKTCLVVIRK